MGEVRIPSAGMIRIRFYGSRRMASSQPQSGLPGQLSKKSIRQPKAAVKMSLPDRSPVRSGYRSDRKGSASEKCKPWIREVYERPVIRFYPGGSP